MRRIVGRVLATASAMIVLVVTGVLYGAYVYRPAEARDYRPPAEWTAASRYVDTPLARFHYVQQGSGSPVVLLSPGAAWTFAWKEQIPVLAKGHTVYVAARSVTTSTGRILVVAMARSKNRRAAIASRRGETSASMTWPNSSTAR
jgi:hypothetical protein